MKAELIFVYNADNGLFNAATDFAHKFISPSTYACNLCKLTYGNFSMKREWKSFIQQLPVDVVFLHKNEFEKKHSVNANLPAVFTEENNKLNLFISNKEINNCVSLQQLKELITTQLALHVKRHYSNL